ncbi:RHS repeat-associated protein [Aquimarina sp. EL_43]|uniref:DUF6443 domain-containing protein n=1 Tax=unclassified Aquimarina TaxID=2627091 RepID=UPI0018CA0F17|nr:MULTISPECIES: DUF6443 domain-containing protein [unclassified Aquimarina]MBG6130179.1 RHS repeat-associated protein [Aquimarina sp. EL_35]MBG6148959.1 RHS repeat-associated protein [Aquimarina sp. EL_32]MBG6168667.1 RHS repeat-associated protein [Aquimarina sp. EL_43]
MKKQIIYSIIVLLMGLKLQAQVVLSDKNYIHTVVPQTPMVITELENVNCSNINDIDRAIESVTYFDGLGRPIQQRAIKASRDGKDIVTHITYDAYGRQDKQYLPFEASNTIGSYKEIDVNTDINQYYKDTYASDFPGITDLNQINAYSESVFDKSPLNRVLEQGAPGTAWKAIKDSDTDHTIKFDWNTNIANEVVHFKVNFANPGNTEDPSLVKDTHYDPDQLYVTITKDENWTLADGNNRTTREYKDKQGRVVLKRTFASTSSATPEAHDTYYVYDRFGNLTYVIPPKVTTSDGVSDIELAELCYQYRYDYKNRLIEKKIPGKDWEYIVYNTLDQPIMTQDASLRKENSGKPWDQWLFTKYDAFGRVVYTGTIINGSYRNVLQSRVNNFDGPQYETKSNTPISIAGTPTYYSLDAYPKTGLYKVYTINYYDNYTFDTASINLPATTAFGQDIINHDNNSPIKTKGLPTGSKVRVLETNDWITSLTGYDKKGRPIYIASKNEYLNTTDIVETQLDFVGKVTQTKTTHTKDSSAAIVTIDTFTYDHIGRMRTQTQKINDQAVETIVENTYDALGQLENKKTGGGLQEVDYSYNVRGWLTKINDPDIALGNKLFAFGINYNTTTENLGATALYNGNISETSWKTANDNTKRGYGYQYDALNRIISASGNDNKYTLRAVTYDKIGNILSLNRSGWQNSTAFGGMDILNYEYDAGNKLLKVADTGNTSFGFKDGSNTGNDYTYDANGNMTQDQNKGITGITYNHLNLPKTVTVNNASHTGNITYIYDATGVKLKKITTEGSSLTTEYAGNYVYKNGTLEFFNHTEGIVEHEADGYKYVYQFKDHLGNIRLSYKDADKDGTIAQNEIVQEKNYYPFGMTHSGYNTTLRGRNHNYGFNGIELTEGLDLNLYEMDLRKYDPAIARWTGIDPVTHHSMSTYNAFDNNPVFWADPSGANSTAEWMKENGVTNDDLITVYQASDSGDESSQNQSGSGSNNSNSRSNECDDCSKCPETCGQKPGLKPASNYDYTQDVIPGKQAEDIDFILNGFEPGMSTMFHRLFAILDRDFNADAESQEMISVLSVTFPIKFKGTTTLTGIAKNAKWVKPKQGVTGPGLRDHYIKHGEQVGAFSTKQYDISARMTIQNGRRFTYRDRSSGARRVGYYNSSTGLFTATSQTRGVPTIMTHFAETWENLRKLPGFSN